MKIKKKYRYRKMLKPRSNTIKNMDCWFPSGTSASHQSNYDHWYESDSAWIYGSSTSGVCHLCKTTEYYTDSGMGTEKYGSIDYFLQFWSRKKKRIQETIRICLIATVIITCIGVVLFHIIPDQLLALEKSF